MHRRIMGLVIAGTAAVASVLSAAAPASAIHEDEGGGGDQGPDHDWVCVYSEYFEMGYCQQNPLPEELPSSAYVTEHVAWAQGPGFPEYLGQQPGLLAAYATTTVLGLPSCAATLNTYTPGVNTGSIPDPLGVVPDTQVVPAAGQPGPVIDLAYCVVEILH